MSSQIFKIVEHTIDCQHIREYARATSTSQEDVLHLAVKQYIPLDNLNPQEGDLTIIGAHANGFPKELYEPLWEDLHAQSKQNGFRIRSIWIADVAQQGMSGIINEQLLGNDPSWNDHARDLLHMINHFRSKMPMPLVGIGHSLGANILCNLAFLHPRLLSTVVLLDPVIQHEASAPKGPSPAQASTYRRDLWQTRVEAETSFKKQKFYQSWDQRVLDRWCRYGIRDTPSVLYPDKDGVTLATTKHQECFTFLRPSWESMDITGKELVDREMVPDMNPNTVNKFPFYRPEPPNTLVRLPELRPSVLYIFGSESPMSSPEARQNKMELTGTGVGGSGGAVAGRVRQVVLQGVGHLVAMEESTKCADAAALWLGDETRRFKVAREEYTTWMKQNLLAKSTLSDEWRSRIGAPLKPRGSSKM